MKMEQNLAPKKPLPSSEKKKKNRSKMTCSSVQTTTTIIPLSLTVLIAVVNKTL